MESQHFFLIVYRAISPKCTLSTVMVEKSRTQVCNVIEVCQKCVTFYESFIIEPRLSYHSIGLLVFITIGGFMKKPKWWMTWIFVIVLVGIFLSSGTFAQETIVMAVDGNWPPMKIKDADGNLIGYEIDMIKAISTEGGFQIKITEVPWKDIFRELDAGKFDAIMASVSITDERKARFDFSVPYFSAEQLLVVPKSAVKKSYKGKTIAAFETTTGAAALRKAELVTVRSYLSTETTKAFDDLAAGRIDGILCDTPVAVNYAFFRDTYKGRFAIDSELSILGTPSVSEEYGIVVKKGNAEVLNQINRGIKAVKAKEIDYEIRARWIKW